MTLTGSPALAVAAALTRKCEAGAACTLTVSLVPVMVLCVSVAVRVLLPAVVKDVYFQNVLILTLMYAALSQGWNILGGYCGQISLGHALYFGLGAYTSTVLFTKFGIIPWIGMAAGGALSAAVALGLGYPCFRLRGHYFTIATIVIAETGYHRRDGELAELKARLAAT